MTAPYGMHLRERPLAGKAKGKTYLGSRRTAALNSHRGAIEVRPEGAG
jgi:hypothetical protein